tara:strand:- start:286 stop:603 length:318 start_codon:yes stop_codon:yes gene_type:complete
MKKTKNLPVVSIILYFFLILPIKSDSLMDIGKDIFLNKGACSTCHMLSDANSNGQIGPNLDQIRPDKIRVITAVTNGIGVMPAYEGQLTVEEIEAVAHYVSEKVN